MLMWYRRKLSVRILDFQLVPSCRSCYRRWRGYVPLALGEQLQTLLCTTVHGLVGVFHVQNRSGLSPAELCPRSLAARSPRTSGSRRPASEKVASTAGAAGVAARSRTSGISRTRSTPTMHMQGYRLFPPRRAINKVPITRPCS